MKMCCWSSHIRGIPWVVEWFAVYQHAPSSMDLPQCFMSCYEWTFTSLLQFPQAAASIAINKTKFRKRLMKNYRTLPLVLHWLWVRINKFSKFCIFMNVNNWAKNVYFCPAAVVLRSISNIIIHKNFIHKHNRSDSIWYRTLNTEN